MKITFMNLNEKRERESVRVKEWERERESGCVGVLNRERDKERTRKFLNVCLLSACGAKNISI